MKSVRKAIILFLAALILCMSFSGCTKKASTDTNTNVQVDDGEEGKLMITVLDKDTKKPISDARVVILGVDNIYKTDDKGQSPEITLKINKDIYKKYGDKLMSKAPAGVSSVLITKDGYKDYIVFNKSVYPGYTANTMTVQMPKLGKSDKDKYVVDVQYPHEQWIQELVVYCKDIKDENEGNGENKLSVLVKDGSSKPVEGAFITVPELGMKVKTGKDGKAVLKPPVVKDTVNYYPVKRDFTDYTLVITKEEYSTMVWFNVVAGNGKDESMDVVLKKVKTQGIGEVSLNSKPFEKEWVEKVISNYNENE